MKRSRENENTDYANKKRRNYVADIIEVFNNPLPQNIGWLVKVMPQQINMHVCDLLLRKMSMCLNDLYKKREKIKPEMSYYFSKLGSLVFKTLKENLEEHRELLRDVEEGSCSYFDAWLSDKKKMKTLNLRTLLFICCMVMQRLLVRVWMFLH